MATILEFQRRVPAVYLSSNKSDYAAIREAEADACALSTSAKVFVEDLNQWKLFRKLLRQDHRGIISLEFVIFRPGTNSVKEALFRQYGKVQDLSSEGMPTF